MEECKKCYGTGYDHFGENNKEYDPMVPCIECNGKGKVNRNEQKIN